MKDVNIKTTKKNKQTSKVCNHINREEVID